MAVYKVPQDVEADDKLIGPISFRQFIYLIIVAISMAASWGLSQLFIPLAIVPLPFIVFFAALALPLRKDQPMEAYLTAVVSFYFLKSRKRFWIPDGIESFVTIIPPKDADKILTKEFGEGEANKRLDYLAQLVDTHGWSIRGAGGTPDTSISTDLYYESQAAEDMFDKTTPRAQSMTQRLSAETSEKRDEAVANMQKAAKEPPAPATPAAATAPPASQLPTMEELLRKEEAIRKREELKNSRDAVAIATALAEEASDAAKTAQSNVQKPVIGPQAGVFTTPVTPVPKPAPKTPANTSVSTPENDTMVLTREQAEELSRDKDLKVSTIAEEANRMAEKNKALKNGEEVTISLR